MSGAIVSVVCGVVTGLALVRTGWWRREALAARRTVEILTARNVALRFQVLQLHTRLSHGGNRN